ncbi:MAG: hypothetical protein U0790_02780 [Isosphaeraceae bacterium]
MIGLCEHRSYTARSALEAYCRDPTQDSASARFVLAYQYLTKATPEVRGGLLRDVVALQPADSLSAKLLKQLDPPKATAAADAAPAAAPAAPAADLTPPAGASIAGTWTAQPAPDTRIGLTIQADGSFAWQVTQKGQAKSFSGKSTFGEGLLTLAQDQGPALVGRVGWKDANHIAFHIVGEGPDDPGLTFTR